MALHMVRAYWHWAGGGTQLFSGRVCGPDFRSVGLANWYLPLKRGDLWYENLCGTLFQNLPKGMYWLKMEWSIFDFVNLHSFHYKTLVIIWASSQVVNLATILSVHGIWSHPMGKNWLVWLMGVVFWWHVWLLISVNNRKFMKIRRRYQKGWLLLKKIWIEVLLIPYQKFETPN